jgi:hypothetical protein
MYSRLSYRAMLILVLMGGVQAWEVRADAVVDDFWIGLPGGNYNVCSSWSTGIVPGGVSPHGVLRAVIGTESPMGALNGSALLTSTPPSAGGLFLGARQRDSDNAFVNPTPVPGTLIGSLLIGSGTLSFVSDPRFSGADGGIKVGVDGRGYLTMIGGTLSGQSLTVAGEDISIGGGAFGTSFLDLSGTASLNVSNGADFSRRVSITGPNVNFNSSGELRLESTNTLLENITNATAHSPLKTASDAIVSGSLVVNFSGAAATRDPVASVGQTWDLVDSSLSADAIVGHFTNLAASGDVAVTGLAMPQPAGAGYRARTISRVASGVPHSVLQLAYVRLLDGDFNLDGVVDSADYTVWRDKLGSRYSDADYDVWKENFGNHVGGGSGVGTRAAVSEPATRNVLLFGMLLCFACKGWSRSR